jgi:hypothetical protein
MSKREALQYCQRHYNERTGRMARWPLSKEFLTFQAVRTAASELLGEHVEYVNTLGDGTLYAIPVAKRRLKVGRKLRLVSVSRRNVVLETL